MKKSARYPMPAMGSRHDKLHDQGDFTAIRHELAVNRVADQVFPGETQRDTAILVRIVSLIVPNSKPDA